MHEIQYITVDTHELAMFAITRLQTPNPAYALINATTYPTNADTVSTTAITLNAIRRFKRAVWTTPQEATSNDSARTRRIPLTSLAWKKSATSGAIPMTTTQIARPIPALIQNRLDSNLLETEGLCTIADAVPRSRKIKMKPVTRPAIPIKP